MAKNHSPQLTAELKQIPKRLEALFEYLDQNPLIWQHRVKPGDNWMTLVDDIRLDQADTEHSILAQVMRESQNPDAASESERQWALDHAEVAPLSVGGTEATWYYHILSDIARRMLRGRKGIS